MNLHTLLYPPRCPFCGEINKDGLPCDTCLKEAVELTEKVCSVCGAYPENCVCRKNRYAFTRNVSAYYYDGPARHLLLRFKGSGKRPQLADFMVRRMLRQIEGRLAGHNFAAVAFMPSSTYRNLTRGFAPAHLLAEGLAEKLDLPLINPLKRRLFSRQQKAFSSAARWEHARKLYRLRRDVTLSGEILLVDDLFTTGASLSTCAALLRKAGADRVFTVTFAIKKY